MGPVDPHTELPASSDGLTAFLDLSPDAVVVVGQDGRIRFLNREAERLFGHPARDLVGRSIEMLVPLRHRPVHELQRGVFTAAPSRRPMGAGRNLHACRADGTEIPVDISLTPILTEAEPMVAAVIRDVTERQAAEDQLHVTNIALEEANARLQGINADLARVNSFQEQFVSMASHELRTPLTTIAGFAETLERRWDELDDQRRRDYLGVIQRSVSRQTTLLSDLLDVSRIRAGRVGLRLQWVEVKDLVDQALEALTDEVDVEVDLAEGLAVKVDEVRAVQVVVNLLTNAAKYGRGPVEVSSSLEGGTAVLRVRDHGEGVPASFEPRLFEMFAQASQGDQRTARGTGLGLFIVRELTHAHGGTVRHRRPDDGGAEFEVRLPVA